MKKGYTIIGTIMASMIIMVAVFSFISKDKLDIKTIEGSLSELDDISLVYTPAIKDLKKEEIVISKDGVKSVIKSDYTIGRDFIKSSSEHNDILKSQFVEYIYENNDYIGTIRFVSGYGGAKEAYVKDKNKDTGQVISYTIPVDTKDYKIDFMPSEYYSTKYEDNIYTVGFDYSEDNNDIYIVKTNLKNQTSEIIIKNSMTNDIQHGGFKFTLNNKIYIELMDYTEQLKSYFLIYDIQNNTLSKSNEFMDSKLEDRDLSYFVLLDYNVTGNKLNVLIRDYKQKDNNTTVTKLVYNIDNNNITFDGYNDYNLDIKFKGYFSENGVDYDDNGRNIGIKKVKMVDDKIYAISQNTTTLNRKTDNDKRVIIQGNKPVELLVFDTNKNKTVYKGEIITGDKEVGQKLFFVKDY